MVMITMVVMTMVMMTMVMVAIVVMAKVHNTFPAMVTMTAMGDGDAAMSVCPAGHAVPAPPRRGPRAPQVP